MPKNHNELLLPKVRSSLDNYSIVHGVMECDPNFADTADFCSKYGIKPQHSANTIIVASKGNPVQFAACVILATTRLDVNKAVCELMGVKRASFARGDQVARLTGMKIGGVTVFGLPDYISIYIDSKVMDQSEVIMGGGNRTSKVRLDPRELSKLPNTIVHQGLAHSR